MDSVIKAIVFVFMVCVTILYTGYVFCASLWNHQFPSLVAVLFAVIAVLLVILYTKVTW